MSSDIKRKSSLINPVKARDINEPHRAATPLELFYDLVYVVAIAFLAKELHHSVTGWHHVSQSVIMYMFIFWCIWWPWNTYTWFASGFDTDDAQFRFASFMQMIGVIICAVGVKPAFSNGEFLIMTLGYIVMRIPYILMWLKVAIDDLGSRPVALRYAAGVFILQIGWIYAVLLLNHWYVFVTLLVCELLVPWFAERSVNKGSNTKYHHDHIEERMGLLTIIVLGESILAVVNAFDIAITNFTLQLAYTTLGALMILFSMWWLYFEDKLGKELLKESSSFIWGYGHYLIYASAAAVGAMISVCVDAVSGHGMISQGGAVLALAIALSSYLIAVWLCHDFLLGRTGTIGSELVILAIIVLLLAYLTSSILMIGLAFAVLNGIRLWRHHCQY